MIVGFQKCGSSSLFDLLCKHPNIKGTKPKETFSLTDPTYQNYNYEKAWGTSNFSWNTFLPDKDFQIRYFIEASVCNFYQKKALTYALNQANIKIIFIIRDPIERFESNYHYYGGSGIHLKPNTTIEEYYQLCLEKRHNHEAMNFALEHGRYSEYIEIWGNTLGYEHIYITSMKNLIKDVNVEFNRILHFLELDEMNITAFPQSNTSKVKRFPKLNRFLSQIIGGKGIISPMAANIYNFLTNVKPARKPIPASLKATLKSYYVEEYRKLKDFF